jgi:hypothetical protein
MCRRFFASSKACQRDVFPFQALPASRKVEIDIRPRAASCATASRVGNIEWCERHGASHFRYKMPSNGTYITT